MIGFWTPWLALPSDLSLAAHQGLVPALCFGSLGHLKLHMGYLWHHSVLLEIKTFSLGGSILLPWEDDGKQAILWWEPAWDLTLLLWLPSLQGHLGTTPLQVSSSNTLDKQRLLEMVGSFCSLSWLVTRFPKTSRNVWAGWHDRS